MLIKSEAVMLGYRDLPERTAETLHRRGWLRKGDNGEFDEDGYLKIVDRKKELIINAAPQDMSPANIEGAQELIAADRPGLLRSVTGGPTTRR